MVDRIRAAVDARDRPLGIMARTDALANEGLASAIERCQRYVEAGADMIFAEAIEDPEEYRRFTQAVSVPVLANMTEFGRTPLLSVEALQAVGVAMILYPLSAFRAMSRAAQKTYEAIRRDGTQRETLEAMQSREELYRALDYHRYEAIVDRILRKEPS
jgi:methylisocitrate lyase